MLAVYLGCALGLKVLNDFGGLFVLIDSHLLKEVDDCLYLFAGNQVLR